MESEHCRTRCQFYAQKTASSVPLAGALAWSVYVRLSSPAVERFHLEADVFECLGLRLTSEKTLELIGQLDAILAGVEEARRQIKQDK
jgi:hypothetical protein